jgi:hypothetical protein
MPEIKEYQGRVPACGCFCGGCPIYLKLRKPCPGASLSGRCEKCASYHLCCRTRGIDHCFQCDEYPCAKFRRFSRNWLKYGQDLRANQAMLAERGVEGFLRYWLGQAGKEVGEQS